MGKREYIVTKPIVLIGLMGSGKTAIGTLLAEELNVPFMDSDAEIENAANQSIAEIFKRDGEAFFRNKESQILERLLGNKPMVLSTGGGAFLRAENQEIISQKGVSVWLKVDLEILWGRVKNKTTRPLLNVPKPYERLKELMEERSIEYQKSEIHVEANENMSKEDMRDHVIETLLNSDLSGLKRKL